MGVTRYMPHGPHNHVDAMNSIPYFGVKKATGAYGTPSWACSDLVLDQHGLYNIPMSDMPLNPVCGAREGEQCRCIYP